MIKCNYCNREFKTQQYLNIHLNHAHKEVWSKIKQERLEGKKYICKYCNGRFPSQIGLSSHCSRIHKEIYENEKLQESIENNKFECKRCNKRFKEYESLRKHTSRVHRINSTVFYVEYYFNGIWPVCKCGCGVKVKRYYNEKVFRDYAPGHQAKIHNNWGHNPEANKKGHATLKKMYENGELIAWNKGLTKETDERVKKQGEVLSNKINLGQIRRKFRIGMSKLEDYFEENYLNLLEIKSERQFKPVGLRGIFDFKIENQNILIEVDGDFWHCNKELGFEPKYYYQINNIAKDKIKNQWCIDNNYILLRFWESDIRHNKDLVLNKIKETLNLN